MKIEISVPEVIFRFQRDSDAAGEVVRDDPARRSKGGGKIPQRNDECRTDTFSWKKAL